jgi:hypothetical protein
MRKVVASRLLSVNGAAEQSEEFVTDLDDAVKENLKGVSR